MSSLFSKIIAGEIPSYKVYEDDKSLAFLTISPHTEGHTLVIPKVEVDHWDDVPDEYFNHMWQTARLVAKLLKSKLGCARIGVMVAGFEVPHAHIHLIPSESMGDLAMNKAHDVTHEELAGVHAKLIS